MSVKRTCAISRVRIDIGSGGLGFKGESDIGDECYVSMLTQAMMLLGFNWARLSRKAHRKEIRLLVLFYAVAEPTARKNFERIVKLHTQQKPQV